MNIEHRCLLDEGGEMKRSENNEKENRNINIAMWIYNKLHARFTNRKL